VRGGAVGGVSVGRAVLRLTRVGDIVLLVVQWLLLVWGIALFALSLVEYSGHSSVQRGLTVSGFESSLMAPPFHELLFQGTIGLVAAGLGGALFDLRRLYLSRNEKRRP
jgi:hypothetical protein